MSTITAETLTLQQRYDLAVYRHFTAETPEEREATYTESWQAAHDALETGLDLRISGRFEAGKAVAETLAHGPLKTWHLEYPTDGLGWLGQVEFIETRDIHDRMVERMATRGETWNEYHANPDAGHAAIGTRHPDGSFSAAIVASLAYVHEF